MTKEKYNHWLPPLLGASAVAIIDTVYYRMSKNKVSSTLRRHEMVHIEQFERLGVKAFFALYFYEYLKSRLQGMSHWEAHRNISLEKEAYAREKL